ncbi:cell wall-binding repeat-containing protein [Chryseoglobus sp. 28M-23]|uniref:cell wall-binding repeat-containing protein n=1 Tax=Chryseoglobus sp. 28M-23 TaxID=2772253 RepID=UPI001746597B|nr:cell wall-binding repeat-containing protein [Chryseoglobus sp. 28M-23]MBU1250115.1 cell wall-binding repeat-containing protein [Actinomycetota bacterium]MBU1608098.1 cell wall-binding repeat-containing protein [Actinomycetota bacterium]MBU2315060.1 cell wall-binding repeat-containing protein [Actinomycetota bacterium]MBU2386269.1 cell wall-binding repeat-containing protein [Actinomycetota bacterium]QOD93914.1 cell wall-binding repeat-containing protein [Chryseoglobus sp. 28M-23]
MIRSSSPGARLLGSTAALALAFTGLSIAVAAPASAAPAVVYDSIPDAPVTGYSSLAFQSTQTSQFGDLVSLDGDNRRVTEVVVNLTSWACESGSWQDDDCESAVGATFDHPITLNLYEVDRSGADVAAGDLIDTTTKTMSIPYRPSASDDCTDENAGKWQDAAGECSDRISANVVFSDLDVLVGNEVIVAIAYNTRNYGANPLGVGGPYDSLNVSLSPAAPTTGADETTDEMFWATNYGGDDGTFKVSSGWSTFNGLVMRITADSVPAVDPLTEVTVYERDVKANETAQTYTEWHEGNPNGTLDNSVVLADGLHLGLGDPSTVIKGTDLATPEGVTANTLTRSQLRSLVERASVEVASGSVTYQVPLFFGDPLDPTFTTLRSTSLTAGSHSFSQADTWATTRAFGDYGVQETASLGELIDAVFDLAAAEGGGVALAGYGVQADTTAVVPSLVWDDTRYTFTQPVIESCVTTTSTEVTNLALGDWDFSQTRDQGINEFTENGLRVETFGEPGTLGQAKAAGYAPIDIALSDVGDIAFDIADGYTGVRPSLQLGFDADGDGTQDALLVGEPWAYGGGDWTTTVNGDWADARFWVTGGTGFGVPSGGGYPSLGTLDEYLLANPEARILEYGYSLGSGVIGEATIESITIGCAETTFGFELETLAPPVTERLAGDDRYETAVAISEDGFPSGADTVYIANGVGYADALSAAPAAAQDNAPLLLTPANTLPSAVRAELNRLSPATIVIVGGTAAVSTSVENALEGLSFSPSVERVAGADRYATSRAIADYAFATVGAVYIASGLNFPDALTAGPAAAELGGPVILVRGTSSSLDAATLQAFDDLSATEIYIAGGTTVVSGGIQSQLVSESYQVQRTSGDDRYATSVAINENAFDAETVVYLATGESFADALAGSALAAGQGVPLYVSRTACIPENVYESIVALGAETIVLLGGPAALSTDVANLELCAGVN